MLDALEAVLTSNSDCYDHNWSAFMEADVLGRLLMAEKVWRSSSMLACVVVLNCSPSSRRETRRAFQPCHHWFWAASSGC